MPLPIHERNKEQGTDATVRPQFLIELAVIAYSSAMNVFVCSAKMSFVHAGRGRGVKRDAHPSDSSAVLLVLLQVPAGGDRRFEAAVVLLRLVLELDLAEVERELVRWQMVRTIRTAGLIRAHDQILERDHVVVLLVLALLANEQLRLLDVLAIRAGHQQQRARFVDLAREVAVLVVNLAGAGAAAVGSRTVVGSTPGVAFDLDRVRVLTVLGLTLDTFDFKQMIGCHD